MPNQSTLKKLRERSERMVKLLDMDEVPPEVMDDFVRVLREATDQYFAERRAEEN